MERSRLVWHATLFFFVLHNGSFCFCFLELPVHEAIRVGIIDFSRQLVQRTRHGSEKNEYKDRTPSLPEESKLTIGSILFLLRYLVAKEDSKGGEFRSLEYSIQHDHRSRSKATSLEVL